MPRQPSWHTHVRTTLPLRGLHPVLTSWIRLLKDSCRSDDYEDNPWWYNERASLSTLAGAAWRLPHWQALEEFSTSKRGVSPRGGVGSGSIKRGRCDLYVSHGTKSFGIEAKQAWQSMGVKSRCDHVSRAMKLAKRDAGNLEAVGSDHRLGVVFTALYVPMSSFSSEYGRRRFIDKERVHETAKQWLSSANLSRYDAFAYAIARKCDGFVSTHGIPRIFPGVLLTITKCKTGTKQAKNR